MLFVGFELLVVYAYACFMHAYAYLKCMYLYNWAAHAYPMYVHIYSCLEMQIHFPFSSSFFTCSLSHV